MARVCAENEIVVPARVVTTASRRTLAAGLSGTTALTVVPTASRWVREEETMNDKGDGVGAAGEMHSAALVQGGLASGRAQDGRIG